MLNEKKSKKSKVTRYVDLAMFTTACIVMIISAFLIIEEVQFNVTIAILLYALGFALIGLNEYRKTPGNNKSNLLFGIGAEICFLGTIIIMLGVIHKNTIAAIIPIGASIAWMIAIAYFIRNDLIIEKNKL